MSAEPPDEASTQLSEAASESNQPRTRGRPCRFVNRRTKADLPLRVGAGFWGDMLLDGEAPGRTSRQQATRFYALEGANFLRRSLETDPQLSAWLEPHTRIAPCAEVGRILWAHHHSDEIKALVLQVVRDVLAAQPSHSAKQAAALLQRWRLSWTDSSKEPVAATKDAILERL